MKNYQDFEESTIGKLTNCDKPSRSDNDQEDIPFFKLAKQIKLNQYNDQVNSGEDISDVKTENYYLCMKVEEESEMSDLETEPIIDDVK